MRRLAVLGVLLSSWALAADGPAQSPTVPKLGERYSGPFDVSFKPFENAKTFDRAMPDEIVRFVREDKSWQLTFKRFELPDPIPLRDTRDENNIATAGYQSLAVNKIRSADANADIVRNDIIELGDLRIGLIAASTEERKLPVLQQQAIIEVTPRLYYSLSMSCPLIDNRDPTQSPAGQEAAVVFKGIVDSIERVDLSELKRDQDERLFRTRGLFAQWNRRKLLSTLQPQRYIRVKRDGRDVGYVYVVEQPADALPKAGQVPQPLPDPATAQGFRIGRRTHLLDEGGKVVDTESWSWVTFDRGHEVWSIVTIVTDPAGKTPAEKSSWFSELGASDRSRERVFDKDATADTFKEFDKEKDKQTGNTPFREVERYKLGVTSRDSKKILPGAERQLPPFYLPQGLAGLLPRLVPANNPTGYLFATWQGEQQQLMMRYVDVAPEADVTLDGKKVRAVAVSERVGVRGVPTTHYLSRTGEYLGSKPGESKIELLPTDKATLQSVWPGIELKEPEGTK